jgi:hypothetical protein
MRIIANKVLTDWELKESTLPKSFHKIAINNELAASVGKKLLEMSPLFYEERVEELKGTEYCIELLVFNKNSIRNILLDLQKEYNISDVIIQKLWLTLLNTI